MFWNDPKLYSANIPTNYFLPNREIFDYNRNFLPWQQFSHYMPHENFLPTQYTYPRFDFPKFDYPVNYLPFMPYGFMDRPQFPHYYKPFVW